MFTLSSLKRRLVYVCTFEFFAVLLATLFLSLLSGSKTDDSFPLAIIVSTVAVVWNYFFNLGFEAWERRKNIRSRTLRVRLVHTLGFEGGLVLVCLPIYMLWYRVGPWTAFTMVLALMLFFLVYTFIFTWLFDKLFTLPQQQPAAKPA